MLNTRIPLFLRHIFYNLRGGFLVRPLIIALALGIVGGVLSSLELAMPEMNRWVPAALFPNHFDPQVAQAILGDIATAVMTVVSIVFAILLMSLTLASMQFSPRIIVSFAKDRVTQWTLGIFLGTFSYCIAALPAARFIPARTEPVITVMGAMLLSFACVCWLLFFIHHISQAISVNYIVDRIAMETEAIIEDLMPLPAKPPTGVPTERFPIAPDETAVVSKISGYVRFVDVAALMAFATKNRITIRVLRRVGHFIPEGVPLLMVSRPERLEDEDLTELLGAFDLGPSRTLQQDVEFGVLQIVDIALKAISPAVNDPSTGICCVDHLGRLMIRYGSKQVPEATYYDLAGNARVYLAWITFSRMLDSAFEQIRMYARSDAAVSLRLLRALNDIAAALPNSGEEVELIARGKKIVDGCQGRLADDEMKELRLRLAVLEEACGVKP
jgi:uncharacterized membrane protein